MSTLYEIQLNFNLQEVVRKSKEFFSLKELQFVEESENEIKYFDKEKDFNSFFKKIFFVDSLEDLEKLDTYFINYPIYTKSFILAEKILEKRWEQYLEYYKNKIAQNETLLDYLNSAEYEQEISWSLNNLDLNLKALHSESETYKDLIGVLGSFVFSPYERDKFNFNLYFRENVSEKTYIRLENLTTDFMRFKHGLNGVLEMEFNGLITGTSFEKNKVSLVSISEFFKEQIRIKLSKEIDSLNTLENGFDYSHVKQFYIE